MLHLNSKTYGHTGHPVLILHGLLGMLDNWQTQSKKYAEAGFKVFAVDQRNHGKSPHSDTFNYEVMADDVRGFMSHHHIPSAHVLGHSMGGKTAMQFALTFPELVNKLIIVDVAPRTYASGHDEILEAMCSLQLRHMTSRRDADAEIAKRIPDFHLRQFILKNLTRTESGGLKWKANLSIITKRYPEIAGDITVHGMFDKPALFIRGGRSRYVLDDDRPRIRKLFPRSAILTINDTGHWVHSDKPEEFGNAVLKFLQYK